MDTFIDEWKAVNVQANQKIDTMESKIDTVESSLDKRIDGFQSEIDQKFDIQLKSISKLASTVSNMFIKRKEIQRESA